jgi:hypothetical protein
MLSVIMLNVVVMLSVISHYAVCRVFIDMLNVVMLSVIIAECR